MTDASGLHSGGPGSSDSAASNAVRLFATNRTALERDLPSAIAALKSGDQLWIAYPSPDSGVETDLSRNHGWGALQKAGLWPSGEMRIDRAWDAIRFEPQAATMPAADMLPVGRHASIAFRLVRAVAKPIFHMLFRFDVKGRERAPQSAYVLIANHLGWMDAISLLLLFPAEPRIHYLADPTSMMRDRPLWALVRATGGIVPVDRTARDRSLLFHQVDRCLRLGGVVAIFPEGDFGPSEGRLLPFKKGFAHFAVDAGVPVLPVGLAGMKELWLGKRLYVNIGEPIATEGKTADELCSLAERAVGEALPTYSEPAGRKPLRRWLTGLF